MHLFRKFIDYAPNKLFISIVLGVASGILYALLLPIFTSSLPLENSGLSLKDSNTIDLYLFEISRYKFAILFFICCIFILIFKTASQVMLVQLGMDVTTDLRTKIYDRVMRTNIFSLDSVGSPKLMATITTDVSRVVQGAKTLPDIFVSSVSLLFIMGYLFYLNTSVFIYALSAIVIGSLTYIIPMYFGSLYFRKGRYNIDRLHVSIRSLLSGTKELKMNRRKEDFFFKNSLLKHEYAVLNNDKKGSVIVTAAVNYGDLISFLVIGFVAFVFISYHPINNSDLNAIIMALLLITSPVSKLINALPQISIANISLKAIDKIFENLPIEDAAYELKELDAWAALTLKGVKYKYRSKQDEFMLGPIDLDLKKGEITFIVGGNGSGKSTLGKIISLNYPVDEGVIYFGDNLVNSESINSCRQYISAILTDFYLFDTILGDYDDKDYIRLNSYFEDFKLDKKISISSDGIFSTLSLSDGQKKRLALAISFLDDKDVYLFDEWAADQDPQFKKIFYLNILPMLKSKGKVVVVISHDDRYFNIADKIVTMEDGQIKSVLNDVSEISSLDVVV